MSWPMVRTKTPPGLPTREQIIDFIQTSDTPAGKREIARAFGLSAQQKISLKALLKDMADEGLIDSAPGRAFHKMGGLPKVTVLRVADVDDGGNVWAVPERWEAETPPPRVRVRERGRRSALGIGDRILARTEEAGNGWAAYPMKKLDRAAEAVLGVLRAEGDKLWLQGVDKKERREVPVSDAGGAAPGDLVLAAMAGRPPRITARVVERLGDPFEARSFSLIAIHKHGIPDVFSEEVLAEARKVAGYPIRSSPPREAGRISGREDLRHLPIVAIDPIDARDHDDAVWAKADDSEDNAGGWQAIVAIADVSFYVRPGSELDKSARSRGNSVYFPDRVVPMLPEILSADVCSLKAGQDRAALVCHLTIAKDGTLRKWRFTRAVIRVAANIAYEHAQAAIDGAADAPVPAELVENALKPLWACWAALAKARAKREPLDLDLPERRIVLDEKGRILSVAPRERLDSMRLIEDYMIAANVAAAKALEAKKAPVMYRVHETPGRDKLVALKEYLATFDIDFALGQVIRPSTFNQLIKKVGESEEKEQIMTQILRSQTQAYYAPQNMGHFGLALGSYAHFTSPIRRYADLLVHRALVGAYDLELPAPKDRAIPDRSSLGQEDYENMGRVGEMISGHERRAMEAERETIDRYVAAFLSAHVGEVVKARITGVQNFGFFATVEGLGGDGLVPVSTLGAEHFFFDEAGKALQGVESGDRYTVGQRLELRLAEADPINGALRFELPDNPAPRGSPLKRDRTRPKIHRGRPTNIRHIGSSRGKHKKR